MLQHLKPRHVNRPKNRYKSCSPSTHIFDHETTEDNEISVGGKHSTKVSRSQINRVLEKRVYSSTTKKSFEAKDNVYKTLT